MAQTIFYVRHQGAGVVWQFPFLAEPTEAQIEAVRLFCFRSFGAKHPKGEEYWVKVVSADVLGAEDIPDVPDPELSVVPGVAQQQELSVSAVANVVNPSE